MKKKIVITLIAIIGISIIIIAIYSNNKKYITKNGIKLAISDGSGGNLDSIPEKGMYKVTVTCINAEGSWDYINWQLVVKNVSGNVKCNLEFKIISKTNLNTYVTSLAGTTQGTGQVVHEIGTIYSNYTNITQSGYNLITPAFYTTSWSTSVTSGTAESSALTWDSTNNYYITTPTQTSKYYYYLFNVTQAGGYQLCYKKLAGSTDGLYRYKNATNMYTTDYLSMPSTTETCIDYGNLSTSDVVRIAQKTGGTYVGSFAIYLKKAGTSTQVDTGYRYEGKNPKNYVWFNDELWRIIGVFDSSSHGVSNTNLVKIIRADSIGGLVWDKSNTNDWPNSSLKALLNGAYYDWDTNSSSASTNCYIYSTTVSTTCDYSKKGIKDGYRSMIQNVTWYLGGRGKDGYTSYMTDSIYGYERNSAAIYSGRSASTTGYIGLMYESDYLYGVLASSCARSINYGNYSTAACAGNNWLQSNGYEWTITPSSSGSYDVWYVNNGEGIYSESARYGYAVRPVLYLASSVYQYDGDGSIANPYIIGM